MLLLITSFLDYPLPRSHRHGKFQKEIELKKKNPSAIYSFLFQIKAVAHINLYNILNLLY